MRRTAMSFAEATAPTAARTAPTISAVCIPSTNDAAEPWPTHTSHGAGRLEPVGKPHGVPVLPALARPLRRVVAVELNERAAEVAPHRARTQQLGPPRKGP